jgi:hypothetical protein
MGAGLFATLGAPATDTTQSRDDGEAVRALKDIKGELESVSTAVESGLIGPGLSAGQIGRIRDRFTTHLRAAGKFPDFMEIGIAPFYDVYDWHIRHQQQIQIVRISEQRFAIQFMFTQLIVRWEQDMNYLGVPFDRG